MDPYKNLYSMIQQLPESDGTINPQVRSIVENHKTRNISVVMAFPLKVGGTFMRTALIHLLSKNYQAFLSRGSYASTDQARDIYFPTILNNHVLGAERPMAAVMHCHMYATKPVTSMIDVFKIPTIVNTRNILDTLLSYYEMLENDIGEGVVARDDFVLQTHTGYHQMTKDEKRWHLVNVAPIWYARFYAYWIRYTDDCLHSARKAPLWTTFTDLKDNGEKLLGKIVAHVDSNNSYSKAEVKEAYAKAIKAKKQLRFNKGVSKRGESFFTRGEQETIYKLIGQQPKYISRLEELEIL